MQFDLPELRALVQTLLDDLLAEVHAPDGVLDELKAAHRDATIASRTGDAFEQWLEGYLTQVAVAWVLTCVFVRFLEDNRLIDPVWLAGEGRARDEADDRLTLFFQRNPAASETDYLLDVFAQLAATPAGELFGPGRNALHKVKLSGDAGRKLIAFWRQIDLDTDGTPLKRSFHTPDRDTRFLGDLYQDLSEHAKKTYALLQTPDFVESYILDYTLEPAIATFGLDEVRFIDPTCGSGHFLLSGFKRLFEHRLAAQPNATREDLVREALAATYGVDLNPFAVAIARFRLLIAAMTTVSPTMQLEDTPHFPLNIAVGDTLLHGLRFQRVINDVTAEVSQLHVDRYKWHNEQYSTEDNDLIDRILGQQYHAVVGNPPYITPKDATARDTYRKLYASCHRQYALVCPFYERFFELAGGARLDDDLLSRGWPHQQPGYVGQIVANSFMKREFGSKLIEQVIPHTDLTHVIDTSGAYIPGHGTPTVILFGRNQAPQNDVVTAVLGIRGEPKTPDDPRYGKVWGAIADKTDEVGYEDDFITVSNLDRQLLHTHPWSLRGGGALEVKVVVEGERATLDEAVMEIGRTTVFGEDHAWLHDSSSALRAGLTECVETVLGENVRDYALYPGPHAPYPYESMGGPVVQEVPAPRYFWRYRTALRNRTVFGRTMTERDEPYYAHLEHYAHRLRTPLSITFAFVATHNHFVLDRGGKVFKRSAPVIKLPADATVEDHLGLVGLLNSSTACFWMKQVFFNKGYGADKKGARMRDVAFEDFYEHDGTKIKQFPVTAERPLEIATRLDALATQRAEQQPAALVARTMPTAEALDQAKKADEALTRQMVALQEELDWRCYELYGLLNDDDVAPLAEDLNDLPEVRLGERAFEIVLARKVASGDVNTSWFERHNSTPITEIPSRWPAWYQALVQQRIDLIEDRRFIRLIEQPEYKRRWQRDAWVDREREALRGWLLDRLESPRYFPHADRDNPPDYDASLVSIADIADIATRDFEFLEVAERYTNNPTFNIFHLVDTLIRSEAVPFLPSQRYKKAGVRKRKQWEEVWALQRREDAGEKVKIPKPPTYTSADFAHATIYKMRGKLDVPKERFTIYPGLEHGDDTFVTWAGLDHKQRAQALSEFYYEGLGERSLTHEQLTLVLAGILDMVPWVKQWHTEVDPEFGFLWGDYYEDFVQQQTGELGVGAVTVDRARL